MASPKYNLEYEIVCPGTDLLTAIIIIDASWKVNAYYNGVMRRGDCYV